MYTLIEYSLETTYALQPEKKLHNILLKVRCKHNKNNNNVFICKATFKQHNRKQ